MLFLISFFCFGTIFLPNGDFSVLKEMPEMYQNCKQTEDKDMTFVDFITDHLINIDGCFDNHDKGDQQKPHKYTFHSQVHFQICNPIQNIEFVNKTVSIYSNNDFNFYQSSNSDCYKSSILRPPIFV
jgi:hypothetical protein